jgi:hypothetical protein
MCFDKILVLFNLEHPHLDSENGDPEQKHGKGEKYSRQRNYNQRVEYKHFAFSTNLFNHSKVFPLFFVMNYGKFKRQI